MSLHRLGAWPPAAPIRRVEVAGDSMLPALHAGDRLLVTPLCAIRVGDVVALRDPRVPARVLVKRVSRVEASARRVAVVGDNGAASTDSRAFGTVPLASLLGRCVYRYHPEDRRGGVGRGEEKSQPIS